MDDSLAVLMYVCSSSSSGSGRTSGEGEGVVDNGWLSGSEARCVGEDIRVGLTTGREEEGGGGTRVVAAVAIQARAPAAVGTAVVVVVVAVVVTWRKWSRRSKAAGGTFRVLEQCNTLPVFVRACRARLIRRRESRWRDGESKGDGGQWRQRG
ncbi:hypothetical protein J3E74DRAFT_322316 [Bipolaris maydis]|nr:hypothetical protein J3E74DRAFT_322316 [Bipolaris maydis]